MGNLEIWEFLTGSIFGHFVLFFGIIVSILLLTFVFQAACALADVPGPSFLYALLLVLLTLILVVPVASLIGYLCSHAFTYDSPVDWLLTMALSLFGFVVCYLVASGLYMLTLRVSIKKSVLTFLFEQLLAVLAFSLLYGLLLVILAVIQLARPATNKTASAPPSLQTIATIVNT